MITVTAVGNYPKIGNQVGGQAFRQAIWRLDRGEIGPDDLIEVGRQVTKEVIDEQISCGVDLVTDGQILWDDQVSRFATGLNGLEIGGLVRYFDTNTYYRQPTASVQVSWQDPILVRDWLYASQISSRPVKAIITGPYTLACLISRPDALPLAELALSLADGLNQELKALAAAGAQWLQIDEPAMVHNPALRYPRDFGLFKETCSRLTSGVDRPVALYTYFGQVADLAGLFSLPFDVFGLDMIQGTENTDLLSQLPAGKSLALGLVDARNIRMESTDEVANRIHSMAERLGSDAMYVNPTCGLEFLPREEALRKLENLAGGARLAAGQPL